VRRLLAVLGRDVSQSLSPFLHGAAASACALDVAYVPISCATREKFDRAIDALRELGALGCNITIPYKGAALERCGSLTEIAAAIGAVNTITFGESDLAGDNTDGPGLARVLADLPQQSLTRVQILGAGGAARAAVWAAEHAGAGEIHVSARANGAQILAGGHRGALPVIPHDLAPVAGATLVISCLPKEPALGERAILEWIDIAARPRILDLAYGAGRETPLVEHARARGLDATDGLAMLIEQAALALAGWTGGELSRIRAAMCSAAAL
jgi:shikimate dehydrogenase